jgi:hypothetical protein
LTFFIGNLLSQQFYLLSLLSYFLIIFRFRTYVFEWYLYQFIGLPSDNLNFSNSEVFNVFHCHIPTNTILRNLCLYIYVIIFLSEYESFYVIFRLFDFVYCLRTDQSLSFISMTETYQGCSSLCLGPVRLTYRLRKVYLPNQILVCVFSCLTEFITTVQTLLGIW